MSNQLLTNFKLKIVQNKQIIIYLFLFYDGTLALITSIYLVGKKSKMIVKSIKKENACKTFN